MTVTIDPAAVAARFREELRTQLAEDREPLRLTGILAGDHGPSHTYATYAQRACMELGIHFELRKFLRLEAEAAIRSANADPAVHGIMVYYPIFGTEHDAYLRDLVDPGKDVEGLHSTWARHLYENRRFVDAARTKKAILPCSVFLQGEYGVRDQFLGVPVKLGKGGAEQNTHAYGQPRLVTTLAWLSNAR